jgi:lysyl-tRNA synthetase class 2
MSTYEEIAAERRRKRDQLVAAGMDPFAATSTRTHEIKDVQNTFGTLVEAGTPITIAGRVMAIRKHGGSMFADIFDGTDRLQVFLSKDALPETVFSLFDENIDIADFIDVTGTLFVTKRETRALAVASWRILTKTLAPLPSEYYGLKDEDERFRKRYLDLLLDTRFYDS